VLSSPATVNIPAFSTGSSLRSLKSIAGPAAPGTKSGKRKVIYGLDYRTNFPFQTVTGSKDNPERMEETVVTTYGDAEAIKDNLDKDGMDSYTAKFEVNGSARVQPTNLIRARGNLTRDQVGVWLVTEATHEVSTSDYVTRATAIRGRESELGVEQVSTLQGATERMEAVIRDGKNWEANFLEHVNV
jgi:hypothetical protein